MAIPSIPNNLYVQQANGQVYLSWDLVAGALTYTIARSIDGGISYTTLATPALTNYLDTAVTPSTQYYYQIASTNMSGTSPYTAPQSIIPVPTGEMSLGQLRLMAQQRADRVNSNFVTLPEWNNFINQALFELYDLITTTYEDYFIAPLPAKFISVTNQQFYPLPDGTLTFLDQQNNPFVAPPFFKMRGVDLGLNTSLQAFANVNKFMFEDRNRYFYVNTASTLYGVFNLQYRVMGNQIQFIPPPSAGQPIQIWYIPRMKQLLQDTDTTTMSVSGWSQYVIIRAAKYALDKEESDTSKLDAEILYLKQRIEETATNRDAGQPDKISDVRLNSIWGSNSGYGNGGPIGGF